MKLSRLLNPRSIAVLGGPWARNVIEQCQKMNFKGDIWPVHPRHSTVGGLPAFPRLEDLPTAPDACFIGVNRTATVNIVRTLAAIGAGGAVCFASGFRETAADDDQGVALEQTLLEAAGDMPFLGPNCYGFINYLDGVLLWPDQHGGQRTDRGVAIITQSSNIAINLTMQQRGLPIAYMITVGNQAQVSQCALAAELLEDPRVTALGLYVEGFQNIPGYERLAGRARTLNKTIAMMKVGRSAYARRATLSHTASMAGADTGAQALIERLGFVRLDDLPTFLETLKLLHVHGSLEHRAIGSVSCSGGEAALVADAAQEHDLTFPQPSAAQVEIITEALGPLVHISNPLDYQTYTWYDPPRTRRAFEAMMEGVVLMLLVMDVPRSDRCDPGDWEAMLEAFIEAGQHRRQKLAVVSTLHETLPEAWCETLMARGVAPLLGLREALAAIDAVCTRATTADEPALWPPQEGEQAVVLEETAGRSMLSAAGVQMPAHALVKSPEAAVEAAQELGLPVVLKATGLAHKSEHGGVVVGVATSEEVRAHTQALLGLSEAVLVEACVTDCVAELLVSVTLDSAHGYILTLAAGGTMCELMDDQVHVLLPTTEAAIRRALQRLRLYPLLEGHRGQAAADIPALCACILAVQRCAQSHSMVELELNPVLAGRHGAVAVDALVRVYES